MTHRSLSAAALVVSYPGGPAVLQGADLNIPAGQRLALLGANGSGKTTLLRCLSGSLRPDGGGVAVNGQPVSYSRAGLRRHRQDVQLVTQDPDDQLFSADVAQDVSFGPMNLGLSEPQVRERVAEALSLLGVEHLARRPTHQLSHGERKRVAVAGAVAMRPCVLLLDEPSAGLDPAGVEEMFAALERLEGHGTTIVLSTHDVPLALDWAHSVALVTAGKVSQGDVVDVLSDHERLIAARLRSPWPLALASELAVAGMIAPRARPRNSAQLLAALKTRRPHAEGPVGAGR
jgi:cobalt/nickel transport system ATP-binding protein